MTRATYEDAHTHLSTVSAESTDGSVGESTFTAVAHKNRDRHIFCLVRLAHVYITRCERTTGSEIQCICFDREVDPGLGPRARGRRREPRVFRASYSCPRNTVVNAAILRDAYITLRNILSLQHHKFKWT
jgi:hypothetical protein